jgi:uncharacterized membrane protein (Fun14 family)
LGHSWGGGEGAIVGNIKGKRGLIKKGKIGASMIGHLPISLFWLSN